MSLLRYKDYQGSVSFEDGLLLIQILHIDDLITTQCESAANAQQAFEELVDDYLETCKELAKEPSRPFKGTFNVRVSPSLHRSIAMAAAEAGETMNSWVSKALDERIERQRETRRLFDPAVIARLTEPVISDYVAMSPGAGKSHVVSTRNIFTLYGVELRSAENAMRSAYPHRSYRN